MSKTNHLCSQIMQVIQEICDINKIPVVDEEVHKKPILPEQTTNPIAQRSTTDIPRRTLMERMGMMMLRPVTISNVLPFPLAIHTLQDIVELLHTKLLQSLLEQCHVSPLLATFFSFFSLKFMQITQSQTARKQKKKTIYNKIALWY